MDDEEKFQAAWDLGSMIDSKKEKKEIVEKFDHYTQVMLLDSIDDLAETIYDAARSHLTPQLFDDEQKEKITAWDDLSEIDKERFRMMARQLLKNRETVNGRDAIKKAYDDFYDTRPDDKKTTVMDAFIFSTKILIDLFKDAGLEVPKPKQ